MGLLMRILALFGLGNKKVNVLVVGLDNSGKTTAIERLKPPSRRAVEVAPTVGFSVDEFAAGGLRFTVFDMSGAGRYRALWAQYYAEAAAVIFVADAADRLRAVVARDELAALLGHPELPRAAPLLVLANKADVPGAMPAAELASALGLIEGGGGGGSGGASGSDGSGSSGSISSSVSGGGGGAARTRPWHVAATNALTGEGLEVAIAWLAARLRNGR